MLKTSKGKPETNYFLALRAYEETLPNPCVPLFDRIKAFRRPQTKRVLHSKEIYHCGILRVCHFATIICKRRLACLHHLAPLKAHIPKILGTLSTCPGSELQEMNIVIATTNHQTVMNRCDLTARNTVLKESWDLWDSRGNWKQKAKTLRLKKSHNMFDFLQSLRMYAMYVWLLSTSDELELAKARQSLDVNTQIKWSRAALMLSSLPWHKLVLPDRRPAMQPTSQPW